MPDKMVDSNTIRDLLIDEQEAIQGYAEALAKLTDPQARKVLEDIMAEEKTHVGELNRVLAMFDSAAAGKANEGMQEADEMISDEAEQAWKDLKKSEVVPASPNQTSVTDKLDTISAQLQEVAVDASRAADAVPAEQGEKAEAEAVSDAEAEESLDELPDDGAVLDEEGSDSDALDAQLQEEGLDGTADEEEAASDEAQFQPEDGDGSAAGDEAEDGSEDDDGDEADEEGSADEAEDDGETEETDDEEPTDEAVADREDQVAKSLDLLVRENRRMRAEIAKMNAKMASVTARPTSAVPRFRVQTPADRPDISTTCGMTKAAPESMNPQAIDFGTPEARGQVDADWQRYSDYLNANNFN